MTTIFGWDMSHFDAPGLGDAVAQGIRFITHKAGGDATDPELAAWWAGAVGLDPAKVLLGAYWVLLPGDPAGRADAFLSRLDTACPGWRNRPFLLQADCEKWRDNPATVPDRAEITTFCDRLVARVPSLRPVVYAPRWVYGDGLRGLGYPLWASSYVNGAGDFRTLYPGDSSSRWAAYSGQTPAILQYSSSATIGGQTTSDANAYRGTLEQLVALVAPGWAPGDDMNLTDRVGSEVYPNRTVEDFFSDFWKERDVLWGDVAGSKAARLPAGSPLARLIALPAQIDALGTALLAAIGGAGVGADEVVAGVLAGLTPDRFGRALVAAGVTAEALAAALPVDLAGQVADLLAKRLAG